MPTIRTITASLLLGMLLLPPHWCCAFPAAADVDAPSATQPQACCTIARTVSTAAVDSPRHSDRGTMRSCCAAHFGGGNHRPAEPPPQSTNAASDSDLPTSSDERLPCAFCSPQVVAGQKSVELPLADAWLAEMSSGSPLPRLEQTGFFVRYGATLPISGDTLALHCRWNC